MVSFDSLSFPRTYRCVPQEGHAALRVDTCLLAPRAIANCSQQWVGVGGGWVHRCTARSLATKLEQQVLQERLLLSKVADNPRVKGQTSDSQALLPRLASLSAVEQA